MSVHNKMSRETYPEGFDSMNILSTPLSPDLYKDDNKWIEELGVGSAPLSPKNSAYNYKSLNSSFEDLEFASRQFGVGDCLRDDGVFDQIYKRTTSSSSAATSTGSPDRISDENGFYNGLDLQQLKSKLNSLKSMEDRPAGMMNDVFITNKHENSVELERPEENASLDSGNASEGSSFCDSRNKRRASRKCLTNSQKQAHNKIEKKYRININAKIAGLQELIPSVASKDIAFETGKSAKIMVQEGQNKLNKSMILERAKEYILSLQRNEGKLLREVQALRNEVSRLRSMPRLSQ